MIGTGDFEMDPSVLRVEMVCCLNQMVFSLKRRAMPFTTE